MAIDKVIAGDKYSQLVSKYNANADAIPTSGSSTANGQITIGLSGGGSFTINVPASPDSVISGCSFASTSGGQVTVEAGSYLIDGTTYTIASPVVFNLDVADSNPRIDVIVVNTSSTATFVKGTASVNPTEPTISATELKLGIVIVNESGYGEPDAVFIPSGLAQEVVVATTSDLSTTYSAKTLTASGNGAIVVDGASLSLDDRLLVKDQTNADENGIYIVTVVGDAGTPFEIERATDFNFSSNLRGFLAVLTSKVGATNNGKLYGLDGIHSSLTLDTDDLDFFHIETPFAVGGGGGGGGRAFTTLTSITVAQSPYVISDGERVEVDCSGGNVIITPANISGNIYSITKGDSSTNQIQINPISGTILGDTTLIMESQYDSVEIVSRLTNLSII